MAPSMWPGALQRLQGRHVQFVTGTDEHGEKIALAAAKAGLQPQEHCDGIVAQYKDLWQKVDHLPAYTLQTLVVCV